MKAMINRYREASQEAQTKSNEAIRAELICKYAPLVKYFAERFAIRLPSHISKDELKSAGTIGLFDALDNFDPDKGIKFQTYAAYRIRGAILDELRKMDWAPRSVRRDVQKIEEVISTGAEAVVTSCQQCVRTMTTYVKRNKVALEVLDITQLIHRAIKKEIDRDIENKDN